MKKEERMMREKKRLITKVIVCILTICLLVTGTPCKAAKTKVIRINYKKMALTVGQKKKLKIVNTKKKPKWISKNKKVAIVSKKGVVTAKKKGSVTIIGRIGKKKYTCKVKVKAVKSSKKQNTTAFPSRTSKPSTRPDGSDDLMPNATSVVPPTITPECTSTPTPTPVVLPTVKPTPIPDEGWETGKISGTEEDYNKYFALEMKQYTKKQPNTISGKIEDISYYSSVVGADREAYVYLPPQYDSSKKYPVLYMIHGIGCDRGQWVSLSLNNILSNMICQGEVEPFIAVIPSVIPKEGVSSDTLGSENIGAFTMLEQEFLTDLEPYILDHFAVSTDRKDTGVCGLSMGGMEALHLGFAIKDHFNYIGSFSAAPTLDDSILTTEGWQTTPALVLLCSGTADNTIGDNPYNYHKKLQENQVDHIWYMYPNGGHDDRVWKNGLVNFLLRSYR